MPSEHLVLLGPLALGERTRAKSAKVSDTWLWLYKCVVPTYQNLLSKLLNLLVAKLASLEDEWFHSTGLSVAGEILVELLLALDATVGDLTDLLRVESLPRFAVEVFVEGNDEDGVHEVDKGVTHVTCVL